MMMKTSKEIPRTQKVGFMLQYVAFFRSFKGDSALSLGIFYPPFFLCLLIDSMPTPFLPTRAFQAYQIFAANTNVGKTIVATGLCRAAAIVAKQNNRDVFYLKPVQTGYPVDSDER